MTRYHNDIDASIRSTDFDVSIRTEYTEFTEASTIYNDDERLEEWDEEEERITIVRFSEQVLCKATISRKEITPKEKSNAWYSSQELQRLVQKYVKTCERRLSGKQPKKNSTYRGLENLDQDDALELKMNIQSCVDSVLQEQDRQFNRGIRDVQAIADASKVYSKECRDHALAMGKADERQAQKAYRLLITTIREDSHRSMSSYTVTPSTQDLKRLAPHKEQQQQTNKNTSMVERSSKSPVVQLA